LFRLVLTIVLLSGCAAQQAAPKMSISDAWGPPRPEAQKKAPKKPVTKKAAGPAKPASSSPELQSALIAFGARARQNRAAVDRGTPMPVVQAENWRTVIDAVDLFLTRAPAETSSFDVIRARITLEAELELDARRYGAVDEELAAVLLDRVNRLGLRMADLRRLKVKAPPRQLLAFEYPVSPVAVTSLYGRRLHPVTLRYRQHSGIDLAAYLGQLVTASAPGTVLRAEFSGGYGNLVEIQHPNGVVTRYGHLSQILTEPGTLLKQGDPIGLAGNTGLSTGVHVHFEIWKNGRPVDPLDQLGQPEERRPPLASL
jgi:murein DD-endopeptidase MepM/ murein hydrolase activator NlpD